MSDQLRDLFARAQELHGQGKYAEAEEKYRQLLAQDPENVTVLQAFGMLASQSNRFDLARELMEKSVRLAPQQVEFVYNLSTVLINARQMDAAKQATQRTLELKPDFAMGHFNLARIAYAAGDAHAAIVHGEKALELDPLLARGYANLARAYAAANRHDDARKTSDRAIAMQPDDSGVVWYHMTLQFLSGDLEAGWELYEKRWQLRACERKRHQQLPAWTGQDVSGKTILLWSEQGVGDTFQFVRFAKLLHDRGAHVVLECQAEVKAIMLRCPFIQAVRAIGEPTPHADFQAPLGSLPRLFQIRADTIPAFPGYLTADPKKVKTWANRLTAQPNDPHPFRVGLVWAGNPAHAEDIIRSASLAALAPLANVPGVTFFTLQKGVAAKQAATPPAGMKLHDLTNHLRDFDDTAAFLMHLDLVIAVDTAVCHLAGALNRPVWTLLARQNEWRWFFDRPDSPWYPSMRLFRQQRMYDWSTPVEEMAAALREEVAKRNNA